MILDVIIFGDEEEEEEDVKWREIILQNVLPFSDKAFTMLVLISHSQTYDLFQEKYLFLVELLCAFHYQHNCL